MMTTDEMEKAFERIAEVLFAHGAMTFETPPRQQLHTHPYLVGRRVRTLANTPVTIADNKRLSSSHMDLPDDDDGALPELGPYEQLLLSAMKFLPEGTGLVVGTSGSGKSTTLRCVASHYTAESGPNRARRCIYIDLNKYVECEAPLEKIAEEIAESILKYVSICNPKPKAQRSMGSEISFHAEIFHKLLDSPGVQSDLGLIVESIAKSIFISQYDPDNHALHDDPIAFYKSTRECVRGLGFDQQIAFWLAIARVAGECATTQDHNFNIPIVIDNIDPQRDETTHRVITAINSCREILRSSDESYPTLCVLIAARVSTLGRQPGGIHRHNVYDHSGPEPIDVIRSRFAQALVAPGLLFSASQVDLGTDSRRVILSRIRHLSSLYSEHSKGGRSLSRTFRALVPRSVRTGLFVAAQHLVSCDERSIGIYRARSPLSGAHNAFEFGPEAARWELAEYVCSHWLDAVVDAADDLLDGHEPRIQSEFDESAILGFLSTIVQAAAVALNNANRLARSCGISGWNISCPEARDRLMGALDELDDELWNALFRVLAACRRYSDRSKGTILERWQQFDQESVENIDSSTMSGALALVFCLFAFSGPTSRRLRSSEKQSSVIQSYQIGDQLKREIPIIREIHHLAETTPGLFADRVRTRSIIFTRNDGDSLPPLGWKILEYLVGSSPGLGTLPVRVREIHSGFIAWGYSERAILRCLNYLAARDTRLVWVGPDYRVCEDTVSPSALELDSYLYCTEILVAQWFGLWSDLDWILLHMTGERGVEAQQDALEGGGRIQLLDGWLRSESVLATSSSGRGIAGFSLSAMLLVAITNKGRNFQWFTDSNRAERRRDMLALCESIFVSLSNEFLPAVEALLGHSGEAAVWTVVESSLVPTFGDGVSLEWRQAVERFRQLCRKGVGDFTIIHEKYLTRSARGR